MPLELIPTTLPVPRHPSREDTAADLTTLGSWALAQLALRAAGSALLACCERCWTRWLRARLVEHLRGEHYWAELDRGDFALLRDALPLNPPLLAAIVTLAAQGEENLAIIAWAIETGQPLEDVLGILTVLDLNARRMPRFAWLPPGTRCWARRSWTSAWRSRRPLVPADGS